MFLPLLSFCSPTVVIVEPATQDKLSVVRWFIDRHPSRLIQVSYSEGEVSYVSLIS